MPQIETLRPIAIDIRGSMKTLIRQVLFGVKAVTAHLSDCFDLPWEFLDYPAGL